MKKEKQKQAKELRKKGCSLSEIAEKLHVAKSSVSEWVRGIQLTDEQQERLKQKQKTHLVASHAMQIKYRKMREYYQSLGCKDTLSIGNTLHIMGCLLYLGEGTKNKNTMAFTNIDSDVICLFLRFLRECYNIPVSKIKLNIVCYIQNEEETENIIRYWHQKTSIDNSNIKLRVNSRPKSSKKIRKHHPYGTCTIIVNSTEIVQRIYGAIQKYCNFDKPEWLE